MKEKIIAALLAFFLGIWGFQWFYLGDRERGKKYLIWCVVGIVLSWAIIGFIPLVVLGIMALVDCFTFLFMSDKEFNEKYNGVAENTENKKEILND